MSFMYYHPPTPAVPPSTEPPSSPWDPPLHHLSTPVIAEDSTPELIDKDEWEYEYSTTETDAYYVTLDLTSHVSRVSNPMGRGAFKPKWLSGKTKRKEIPTKLSVVDPEQATAVTPAAARDAEGEGDEDDGAEIDEEDNEDIDAEPEEGLDNAAQDGENEASGAVPAHPQMARDVQILDLHTANPLVSYKGHVYSCKWEENIGTELLFTRRDASSQHPVLRSLPGSVDLLAASAIRISSTPAVLEPTRSSRPQLGDVLRLPTASAPVEKFSIPVGPGANLERKEQAKFLERLVAAKKKKGEEDDVTIIAQKRFTNTGWRAQYNQKRAEERAELTEVAEQGGEQAENAMWRLQEMEEEDEERAQEQRLRSAGLREARRPGRKPKSQFYEAEDDSVDSRLPNPKRQRGSPIPRRPRGGNAAMSENIRRRQQEMSGGGTTIGHSASLTAYSSAASTPTPQSWGELQEAQNVEDTEGINP